MADYGTQIDDFLASRTQGGLPAAQEPPTVRSVSPAAQQPVEPTDMGYDPTVAQKRLDEQRDRVNQRRRDLIALAENRRQMFDPKLLALAQGLLAPTKTGSFGESVGYAAGNLREVQAQEAKRQEDLARMQYELEQSGLQQEREESEFRRQNAIRDLSGKLVNFNIDENTGAVNYRLDPIVAKKLTALTGDTKYAERLIADAQMKAEQRVASEMFKEVRVPAADGQPEKVVYKFNPQAVMNIAKVSTNPVETIAKYAKMIPDLRKSGLIEGISDNGTPFDAIATMAPTPAIKAQAERLAKQYKEGRLDEDKANSLAQQMLSLATSHMDRAAQRDLSAAIAGLNAGMRREGLEMRREALDRQRLEDSKKLTDEQKITYRQVVVPIINQADKALDAMNDVDRIRTTISSAPSGLVAGVRSATLGRVFGTDENTAMRKLESWSKEMIARIPRLPGSASNLDAQNLEKSLGNLTDKTLTNSQRMELLDSIYDGFKRLSDRGYAVQDYWDQNKKMLPLDGKAPAAPAAPANRKPLTSFGG